MKQRWSNEKHQTIFEIAEATGKAAAELGNVSDVSGMANQMGGHFTETRTWVEQGQEVAITPFESQVYAAGFVDGYKQRRKLLGLF